VLKGNEGVIELSDLYKRLDFNKHQRSGFDMIMETVLMKINAK